MMPAASSPPPSAVRSGTWTAPRTSAETPGDPSVLATTTAYWPDSTRHWSVASPGPVAEASQNGWAAGSATTWTVPAARL